MREDETPAAVPMPARRRAEVLVGPIRRAESLGGLSGRTVAAMHGARDTVVVKGPVVASEVAVAGPLSSLLAAQGVPTPRVHDVLDLGQRGTWLVMEHLPDPLPRERWGADPAVVAVLRALHAVPRPAVEQIAPRYQPCWDAELTTAACDVLGATDGARSRLAAMEAWAQPLFRPTGVVSGDPNPMNWRLDHAGRPVLLDWERITLASPAVDLAILLPGLPDRSAVAAAVDAYGDLSVGVEDVLLAKAWSVVELAARSVPGSPARDLVLSIAANFLDWLATDLTP